MDRQHIVYYIFEIDKYGINKINHFQSRTFMIFEEYMSCDNVVFDDFRQ